MEETTTYRLPGSDKLRDAWRNFRATSSVFTDAERAPQLMPNGKQKDEWGFCISEYLNLERPSIFFLGLNPSSPAGATWERFGADNMGNYFSHQRQIADDVGRAFSYWDVFPVRQTAAGKMVTKIKAILDAPGGSQIIGEMLAMVRTAIRTVKPEAVCVCNAAVRNAAAGIGGRNTLTGILRDAHLLPLFPLMKMPCYEKCLRVPKGHNKKFYYTTMKVDKTHIPVIMGGHLGEGYLYGPQQKAFIAEILKNARQDPEKYYDDLPKNGWTEVKV